MANAGALAASSSSRTSNDHQVAFFPTGDPRAALEPRETRPRLTLVPAAIEPLHATAIVRTVPFEAAAPERRTRPSWRALLAVLATFTSLGALVLTRGDAQASFEPSSIDRGMVVESLQNLSDYVGFEGHFALGADDHTLVMTGSDLCGDDFPQVVPPALWHHVVDSGFLVFECSAAGTHVRLEVHP